MAARFLHGFCTVGVFHVRLCRALYCIAIGFRCPLVLAALLGQPVHQELCHRHGGPRPSTAIPIRASFCRRTGACRSLSQPLFRVSWNQGVTHWTLQAKLCAKGVLLLACRLGQVLQNALHFEVDTGDPHPFGNPRETPINCAARPRPVR